MGIDEAPRVFTHAGVTSSILHWVNVLSVAAELMLKEGLSKTFGSAVPTIFLIDFPRISSSI